MAPSHPTTIPQIVSSLSTLLKGSDFYLSGFLMNKTNNEVTYVGERFLEPTMKTIVPKLANMKRDFSEKNLPLLPTPIAELSYMAMKRIWSPVIKSACPGQRTTHPYPRGDKVGIPPPFVPVNAVWVNFLDKNTSEVGKKNKAN